jgi:chloramphenicol-sensitive protein RarD
LPFYWQWLDEASATEILAHRGVWSLIFCIISLIVIKRLNVFTKVIGNFRTVSILAIAAGFLTINWGVYIWSVTVNRVVEASLGYYVSPLMTVFFGVLILKEKLTKLQKAAVIIAGIGVLTLTLGYGHFPWVGLALAGSWGGYSLIKKKLELGALESLSIETLIAFLPNLIYIWFLAQSNTGVFGSNWLTTTLLAGAGVATIVPLLFFNGATNRLPLSTVGLLQYITPTIMFFIGVGVNKEAMNPVKFAGFLAIWLALFLLGRDLLKSSTAFDDGKTKT